MLFPSFLLVGQVYQWQFLIAASILERYFDILNMILDKLKN
ncbi:hypothetical protein NSP_50470 [Nodularia spumigena CCY9414]|nr:hypothetical protein NSP_50470 [Nodularia spumigena CCY9414]